jgi:hypothetical protein
MCDIYIASHGNEKLKKELLDWFQANIDPNIHEIKCERCRGFSNECWTEDCELRNCAQERNLEYCFECPDLVCEKLEKFANSGPKHHKRTIENLREMKDLGLKKWISLQKEPDFCP